MRTHRDRLIDDARSVEAAGAYAIVLEVVDYEISREITEMLSIPTIGIGAGSALRFASARASRYPRHVSALAELRQTLCRDRGTRDPSTGGYAHDVRERIFPR